jgi:hypothetical protein
MTDEDWENLEDLKNDYSELRSGNTTYHKSDKELTEEHLYNQMRCYARYPGHLNWEVLNRLR